MHNFYDFFKYLGFTIYNPEQDRWVKKSDKYDGYEYISTHVEIITIAQNNPSKNMDEIEQHFQVRNITDSPDYYLGNELVKVVNNINVSSRKYVKEISLRYQKNMGI